MKRYVWGILFILLVLAGIYWQSSREEWKKYGDRVRYIIDENGKKEYCITCHSNLKNAGSSHPFGSLGCVICHGGVGSSLRKEIAHTGVVKNPARLEFAGNSCGKSGCHPGRVAEVKKSIMVTNRGIISGLRYQWGVTSSPDSCMAVSKVAAGNRICERVGKNNYAELQFRKFCATCHVNKRRGDFPGEIGKRGGGCLDCHYEERNGHPAFTTRISSRRCELCHNRSARVGLSYRGIYEDDNYRTPYYHGMQREDLLSSRRGWQRLVSDVHHGYGLQCIDCHTYRGTMGDGVVHSHMEAQLDISCEDCHGNGSSPPHGKKVSADDLALRLARENGHIELKPGDIVATTKRGTGLYNVQKKNGHWILYRKMDGKPIEIEIITGDPWHNFKGHEKLACSACHSAWAPQCYGCHDKLDMNRTQMDKISMKRTPGRWSEKADFYRFENPPLGVGPDGKIRPLTPGCQVMFSLKETDGTFRLMNKHLGMAAFDPHTTRREVPTCAECHLSPRKMGLGDGKADIQKPEMWGYDFALYRVIGKDDKPLQRFSRRGARPFNQIELSRIRRAGECVICHDSYTDPIYRNFNKSYDYFKSHPGRCPRKP